jgi:hypothetical protein
MPTALFNVSRSSLASFNSLINFCSAVCFKVPLRAKRRLPNVSQTFHYLYSMLTPIPNFRANSVMFDCSLLSSTAFIHVRHHKFLCLLSLLKIHIFFINLK